MRPFFKTRRFIAYTLLILGIGIGVIVILPIVSYHALVKQKYPELISPLVSPDDYKSGFIASNYTRAGSWFLDNIGSEDFDESVVISYFISIPELDINDATVNIGGDDLSKSLIHYPGTALPGRPGNAVIFGHSILPIFYNPKNYLAIFSKLPHLNKGDEIFIDYDGVTYVYSVNDYFEVRPTDIQILAQETGSVNLTLVTCTPPGDPRKPNRLIVRAELKTGVR